MPHAIWRGSISFGLVTIPVRLYRAVRRRDVRFRELDRVTGQRVRRQRVRQLASPVQEGEEEEAAKEVTSQPVMESPAKRAAGPLEHRQFGQQPPAEPLVPPSRDVARSEIVRGYEVSPGRFVEVTDEDLETLSPERTRTMEVEQFVSRKDLDPIYFDSWYYTVPDQDRVRPFALLLRAMQETNRAAICWLVLRSRRRLAALQPRGNLMLLSTLLFADEIVPSRGLEPLLPTDLAQSEVEMAELLINTLAGPFEPERYRDEYREGLLKLIESRAGEGEAVSEPELPPAPSGIEDLMAALTASVEQARARRRQAEERTLSAEHRRRRV